MIGIRRAYGLIITFICIAIGFSAHSEENPLDGARWIKPTDKAVGGGDLGSVLDVDMTVVSGSPAVIFGWTANRAYFQWQIIVDDPAGPLLRRCVRTFTDDPPYNDVALDGFAKADLVGKPVFMRIEASGNTVATYVNGVKVDTYACGRVVPVGKAGFLASPGDEALVNYFMLAVENHAGGARILAEEDFSTGSSVCFSTAEICDGQCRVSASKSENLLLTDDESYPVFFKKFNIGKPVASATLTTSGLGVYDAWVNGRRAGSTAADGSIICAELKPGWTDYNKRAAYATYDVTDMCRMGENCIGAVVAPGWLQGRISRYLYGHPLGLAFIAKMEIRYDDGTSETIVTDNSWSVEKFGPILMSDIYNGEYYDARRDYPWSESGAALACKVETFNYPGELVPLAGSAVRAMDFLKMDPVKSVVYSGIDKGGDFGVVKGHEDVSDRLPLRLAPGQTAIFDFGQNCAGVPVLRVKGPRGAQLRMRFGEMLNDTGERRRGNDGPAGTLYTANLRAAKAEARYILRGDEGGEEYRPTTTFFGYRYCEVTATDEMELLGIASLPLSSSYDLVGSVETDNADVNRLHSNVLWSQLSNFVSVPTDCPQRDERLGWTADAQLFSTTAMYNANVGPFYRKWLCDMRDSQRSDGAYSDVSPLSLVNYGSAGWADAGIAVPWQIYLMTGDKEAVAEHYASMELYMQWLASLRADGIAYPGAYPTYGDLFAPKPVDKRFVSQAYYYYDAVLMAKMSRALSNGRNDKYGQNAAGYEALASAIRSEMQSMYFNEDGLLKPTQGACVISLYFGLYANERQKQGLIEELVAQIRGDGFKLNTGFISTAYILQTLSDSGHDDLSYELLTQHEYPSWLYMVDRGATTMWENWYCYTDEDGFCDVQRNSFNHYGLGSFASWMYSHMAGIAPSDDAPGFEKIIFSPCIDRRKDCSESKKVRRAKAAHRIANGMISAEWRLLDGGELTYEIYVPEGSEGEVRFPVASPDAIVYEGGDVAKNSGRVKALGYRDGRMVFAVKPGRYFFSTIQGYDGIQEPTASSALAVWPSPAVDRLNIEIDEEVVAACATSVSGKAQRMPLASAKSADVSALPPGLYILEVETPTGRRVAKFVKK